MTRYVPTIFLVLALLFFVLAAASAGSWWGVVFMLGSTFCAIASVYTPEHKDD